MDPEDPLERIYLDHARALFRFLLRLTGDEAETKDLLQEIFIRLARSPRLLDHVGAPRSYLFRLAHRLAIDRRRRRETRQRHEQSAHEEADTSTLFPASPSDADWQQQALVAALAHLPPDQRAVVLLKIWEEMTFAQIADVLHIPAHTAASRYRYALDKLHRDLRPQQGELRQ